MSSTILVFFMKPLERLKELIVVYKKAFGKRWKDVFAVTVRLNFKDF
jgi:hypothetical protein